MSSEAYDSGPFGVIRYGRDEMVQHEHKLASGAADVEPGMLIERVDDGSGNIAVQPHSSAGAIDEVYVAIEARGRGMSALDSGYSDGGDSYVRYVKVSGGGINAKLAVGETVAIGDQLVSNGDGYFRALDTAGGDAADAGELEVASPVDNSGGSAAVFVPTEA